MELSSSRLPCPRGLALVSHMQLAEGLRPQSGQVSHKHMVWNG